MPARRSARLRFFFTAFLLALSPCLRCGSPSATNSPPSFSCWNSVLATFCSSRLRLRLRLPPRPDSSPAAFLAPLFLPLRGLPTGCDLSRLQPSTRSARSPTSSSTSGESWVTSIILVLMPAWFSKRRVSRRCSGSTRVTTSPALPARAVRPERCTKDFGSAGGSTCTTSSTPPTSMPRAATSVATMTRTSPESNAARLRSRWFWFRLPCSSAAGMPFCVRFLASFLAWNLVRVNRMRRPLPEASVRTSSCLSPRVVSNTWWVIRSGSVVAESTSCTLGSCRKVFTTSSTP